MSVFCLLLLIQRRQVEIDSIKHRMPVAISVLRKEEVSDSFPPRSERTVESNHIISNEIDGALSQRVGKVDIIDLNISFLPPFSHPIFPLL